MLIAIVNVSNAQNECGYCINRLKDDFCYLATVARQNVSTFAPATYKCCNSASNCTTFESQGYICSHKYNSTTYKKMVCPYNYNKCGQNNTFEFNEGGESKSVSILNLTYGQVCFYMIRGNCALPKVKIDGVGNATVEYTDFLPDVLSMNKTGYFNVDIDNEAARLDFRLPIKQTIFTNTTNEQSNGTLAYSGIYTYTNPYKGWGVKAPGSDSSTVVPDNQYRCQDRYMYVVVTSTNNTMYANLTFSSTAFTDMPSAIKSNSLRLNFISMILIVTMIGYLLL